MSTHPEEKCQNSQNLAELVDPSCADFSVGFLLNQLGARAAGAVRMEVKQVSSTGFLADIYRLRVHFGAESGRAPFSCIFKVPTQGKIEAQVGSKDDEEHRASLLWLFQVHSAECRFYQSVAPAFRLSPLYPLPFHLPELYACRPCPAPDRIAGGFLLMEDVAGEGEAAGVELADGLTQEQAESAIRALAACHALSLSLPRPLVDSFTLITDLDFEDQKLHVSERLWAMPDVAEQLEEMRGVVEELYASEGSYPPDQHTLFGVDPVIVHGDFWLNNLLYKTDPDGRPGAELHALIDWQVCHSGTGLTDLLRVAFVSTAPSLRRAHMSHWLRLYSIELDSALARLGLSGAASARPLPLLRRIAAHHAGYECCFQLFLLANILGLEREAEKRRRLIDRMRELIRDYQEGTLLGSAEMEENE